MLLSATHTLPLGLHTDLRQTNFKFITALPDQTTSEVGQIFCE